MKLDKAGLGPGPGYLCEDCRPGCSRPGQKIEDRRPRGLQLLFDYPRQLIEAGPGLAGSEFRVRLREILEDEIVEAAAPAKPAARFRAGKLNPTLPVA